MDTHQDICLLVNLALYQGNVLDRIDIVRVSNGREFTSMDGGKHSGGGSVNKAFVAHAVLNNICDGYYLEPVLLGKYLQVRHSRHGAIVFHDLTNNPGRIKTRQPGHIN